MHEVITVSAIKNTDSRTRPPGFQFQLPIHWTSDLKQVIRPPCCKTDFKIVTTSQSF